MMIQGIDPMFGSTESTYNHWTKSALQMTSRGGKRRKTAENAMMAVQNRA
jgi:hypothetical protein